MIFEHFRYSRYTLYCELYDSSVFTKRVDGMAGEEARVLPHCGHDLVDAEEWEEVNNNEWV